MQKNNIKLIPIFSIHLLLLVLFNFKIEEKVNQNIEFSPLV